MAANWKKLKVIDPKSVRNCPTWLRIGVKVRAVANNRVDSPAGTVKRFVDMGPFGQGVVIQWGYRANTSSVTSAAARLRPTGAVASEPPAAEYIKAEPTDPAEVVRLLQSINQQLGELKNINQHLASLVDALGNK